MKSRKLIYASLLLAMGSSLSSFAQNYTDRKEFKNANAHWAFENGSSYLVDMRTQPPTVNTLPYVPSAFGESPSAISDTATGELLFYANGPSVFNRNQQPMLNGTGLSGTNSILSTMQQVCFVPVIDSPNKYYVFSNTTLMFNLITGQPLKQGNEGIYYSVVDMSLDNGLGGVVPGKKAIKLYDGNTSEAMIAIPGNNCDVWLLMNPYPDSVFHAYHITSDGIDPNPVVSSVGAFSTLDFSRSLFRHAAISVSPQRDKIAMGWSHINKGPGIVLFKFDPETGIVSNGLQINATEAPEGHVVFSPDGNKLYANVSRYDFFPPYPFLGKFLIQYDVSKYNLTDILASKYELASYPELAHVTNFRTWNDTIILSNNTYIPFPNAEKDQTKYDASKLYFNNIPKPTSGFYFSYGTNGAVYPLPSTYVTNTTEINVCKGDAINETFVATEGYLNYKWNTGEQDKEITVNAAGTYWVAYEKFCHTGVDTFHITFKETPEPIITVHEKTLSTVEEYDSYQWMKDGIIIDDATSKSLTVTENGDYQVIITLDNCSDTSDIYTVNNANNVTSISEKNVMLYPNPTSTHFFVDADIALEFAIYGVEGKLYKNVRGNNSVFIGDLADGIYVVEIKDLNGKLLQIERVIKSNY